MPEDTRFEVKPRNILHLTDSLYFGSSSASSQSSVGFSWDNLQSNFIAAKHKEGRVSKKRNECSKISRNFGKEQVSEACMVMTADRHPFMQIAPSLFYAHTSIKSSTHRLVQIKYRY
jgi:hypothetical protein